MEKMTKSGAKVNICSCESSDYCNFKLWPNQHNDFDSDDNLMASEEDVSSNSRRQAPIETSAAPARNLLNTLIVGMLLFLLPIIL